VVRHAKQGYHDIAQSVHLLLRYRRIVMLSRVAFAERMSI
jgi:hypothetical protein